MSDTKPKQEYEQKLLPQQEQDQQLQSDLAQNAPKSQFTSNDSGFCLWCCCEFFSKFLCGR
jgi:hypothetical protein